MIRMIVTDRLIAVAGLLWLAFALLLIMATVLDLPELVRRFKARHGRHNIHDIADNAKGSAVHAFSREERVKQLCDACDSIKANAADYVGREACPVERQISIIMKPGRLTTIEVKRSCYPVRTIEDMIK